MKVTGLPRTVGRQAVTGQGRWDWRVAAPAELSQSVDCHLSSPALSDCGPVLHAMAAVGPAPGSTIMTDRMSPALIIQPPAPLQPPLPQQCSGHRPV